MINHTSMGHTISFPESVVKNFGSNLVLVNPLSISRLFESMVEHYPVDKDALPKLETVNIESETLPSSYAICSESGFNKFISDLKETVDLITLNDFLSKYKINTYFFKVEQ